MSDFFKVVGNDDPDLEVWCANNRLGDNFYRLLKDVIGAKEIGDLIDIYGDEEMMSTIKDNSTPLDYKKFIKATSTTPGLEGVFVAQPSSASVSASVSLSVKRSESSQSGVTTPAVSNPTTVDRLKQQLEEEEEKHKALEKEQKEKEELEKQLRKAQGYTSQLNSKVSSSSIVDIKSKLKETEKRQKLIKALIYKLKDAASVDICFLLDCTWSMSNHMKNVKEQITEMVRSAKGMYPDLCVRVSFVGYRDHCDDSRRLTIFEFSTDVSDFQQFVEDTKAGGGCGNWADVFGGINVVDGLQWQASTRILFHIGDMPCHGTEWHNESGDPYPSGDPMNLSAEKMLRSLSQKEVQYFFGRITAHTDKMIDKFNSLMEGYVETLQVADHKSLMNSLSKSVSSSITSTFSSSSSTNGKIDSSHIKLDLTVPNWSSIKTENVTKFEIKLPKSMNELKNYSDADCVNRLPVIETTKVAPTPFAKGGQRAAYMAKEVKGGYSRSGRDLVHKVSLSNKSSDLSRQKYESTLSNQCAAIFLAQEFNKIKPSGCPSIHFADAWLLQYLDRKDTPYANMEEKLSGEWEKFNGNNGFLQVNPSPNGVDHSAVQAFSHWTYAATDHCILVVDCQGNFDSGKNTFYLTDPAVHSKDVTRFGGTNLGEKGFKQFFATHVCNGFCSSLKL